MPLIKPLIGGDYDGWGQKLNDALDYLNTLTLGRLSRSSNLADVNDPAAALANLGGLSETDASATYVTVTEQPLSVKNASVGLVGDSVTDNTAALQALVNAQPGREIVWPEGGYVITDEISLPSGTKWRGPDTHRSAATHRPVLIQTTAGKGCVKNADPVAGNDNITLAGLGFQSTAGAGAADLVTFIAAGAATCEGIRLRNLDVVGSNRHGIAWTNVKESWVRDCTSGQHAGKALFLTSSTDNLIDGNSLFLSAEGLMLYNFSGRNIVRGNFSYLNTSHGVDIEQGCDGNIIQGNRVNDNGGSGLFLQDYSGTPKTRHNLVHGNEVLNNAASGIFIDGDGTYNLIIGNVCWDDRAGGARTQLYGIRLTNTTLKNLVTGNLLDNNVTANLLDQAAAGANNVFGNQDGALSGFNLSDGQDVRIAATTGSRIGQSTSKMAFFGATPVIKPNAIPAAATDLASVIALANYLRNDVVIPLGLST